MSEPIRVLVVDDHTLFREGLANMLEISPDIDVVGQASEGLQAVEECRTLQPDIVLMDILMPDMNGIEATSQILAQNANIKIIMVTMMEDDDSLFAAMRAGVRGYILKGADRAEVVDTIRVVSAGSAMFGPGIAARLTAFFKNLEHREAQPEQPFPELTEREREVLDLIAKGRTNVNIANILHLTPKTISNYVSSIYSKLHLADRVQAMLTAREAGLGKE